jgi:hypothetical protein
MGFLFALHYFYVVAVVPRFFIGGFVIAVVAAAARLTSDPSAATEALTPVILLQMFVAPSGFQFPARRGYYDLLLTTGTPRWRIALAHCVASTAPGVGAWLCVSLLELAASHGRYSTCLAAGTCVAVAGVSSISWAGGVFASRAVSGVGWLLLMSIPPVASLASPLRLIGMTTLTPLLVIMPLTALVTAGLAFAQVILGETRLEATQ